MWFLIVNELILLRGFLLQTFGVMFACLLIFSRLNPVFGTSYLTVFPVVMSFTMAQQSFAREERGNTLAYLRSLPIKPSQIVAAKYAVPLIMVALFWLSIWAGGAVMSTPSLNVSVANLIVLLTMIGFSLSYLFHFWLGIKGAQGAILASFFVFSLPSVLLMKNAEMQRWLTRLLESEFSRLASSLAGTGLALLVGGCIMAVSYTIAVRIFSSRDLSRLL